MPIEKLKSENDALIILNSELKLEIESLRNQIEILHLSTSELIGVLQEGEIEKTALQDRLKKMTLLFGGIIKRDTDS